ncbi:PhoD-like phosphatase-domain-containing protein, partial [Mycena leptocephala]
NRQRVLDHLYRNKINNTIILSGDSHANWIALNYPNDTTIYNTLTGEGAIGVEFAGTVITSPSFFGTRGISPAAANPISQAFVASNPDLQLSEGSFRGFFTLTINSKEVNTTYYAMQDITTPNLESFASAVFTVKAGQNKLARPVAGGAVAAGALKSNGTA